MFKKKYICNGTENCTGRGMQFYVGEFHDNSTHLPFQKLHLNIMAIILNHLDINSLLNFYQADKTHRDLVAKIMRKFLIICPFCDKRSYGVPYVDSCHIHTIR